MGEFSIVKLAMIYLHDTLSRSVSKYVCQIKWILIQIVIFSVILFKNSILIKQKQLDLEFSLILFSKVTHLRNKQELCRLIVSFKNVFLV